MRDETLDAVLLKTRWKYRVLDSGKCYVHSAAFSIVVVCQVDTEEMAKHIVEIHNKSLEG